MHATIVDYGMGNIRSLRRALERLGATVKVSPDPKEVAKADRVVIPGQGAFGQAMTRLNETGQADGVREAFEKERPVLGVCLGLQILYEGSEEAPNLPGFGVVKGQMTLLPVSFEVRRPHMGWAPVTHDASHPVFAANPSGEAFYFVHSYAAHAAPGYSVAMSEHGGPIVAGVAKGSLVATQFHPEKSQQAGARLLKAWLHM